MESPKKLISRFINASQERVVWYKKQMETVHKEKDIYTEEWYKDFLRDTKNSEMVWLKSLQEESYWTEIDVNSSRTQSKIHFVESLRPVDKYVLTIDSALDIIMNTIDDYQLSEDFSIIDDIMDYFIHRIQPPEIENTLVRKDYYFSIYIGFLTITCRYRDKYTNRSALFEKAVEMGKLIMNIEETLSTLTGL